MKMELGGIQASPHCKYMRVVEAFTKSLSAFGEIIFHRILKFLKTV